MEDVVAIAGSDAIVARPASTTLPLVSTTVMSSLPRRVDRMDTVQARDVVVIRRSGEGGILLTAGDPETLRQCSPIYGT